MGKKTKTRKTAAKTAKKAVKPRNPHARALKESGLFRPKVVPLEKDTYRRRAKHPKAPHTEDEV